MNPPPPVKVCNSPHLPLTPLSGQFLVLVPRGSPSTFGGGEALAEPSERPRVGAPTDSPRETLLAPPSFPKGASVSRAALLRTAWVSLPLREALPRGRPFHLPNLEVIHATALCHPSFSSSLPPSTPPTAVSLSRSKKRTTIFHLVLVAFSVYRQNGWQHYYAMRT